MIPGSANPLLLASAAGSPAPSYQIERSLRFNSSDSAYLSKAYSTAGDRRTATFSFWIKRAAISTADQNILSFGSTGGETNELEVYFGNGGDKLQVRQKTTNTFQITSDAFFRDPSSWYHIVLVLDTTQATASNRAALYVNGLASTITGAPTQDTDLGIGTALTAYIGRRADNVQYLGAYLADFFYIDGQALDPTSFGEFDANGVWQPKAYTGTYGTNGFHLDFADNSAATTAGIGKDVSGNGNDWTPVNLSVAAGAGNDSLVDTPTNGSQTDTGVGGEVVGNYATWNPLSTTQTLSNGNLDVVTSTNGSVLTTIGISSGKYYCEYTINSASVGLGPSWGFSNANLSVYAALRAAATEYRRAGVTSITLNNHTSNITSGVIGISLDLDSYECKIYHNNNLKLTATGIPPGVYHFWVLGDATTDSVSLNAGQRPFAYPAPSGFKALCTTSLPEPQTITTSGSYTGNGVADGPFVYLNGVPTAMTVNGNAVTFGTHADKLSNGFKLRTTSTTYNQNAIVYNYSITSTGDPFKRARAQSNP